MNETPQSNIETNDSMNNNSISSFPPEQSTSATENNNNNNSVNTINNLAQKEVVTRPLLWGLVVFMVCFSVVIGAVSIYRMYQDDTNMDNLNITIPSNSSPVPVVSDSSILDKTPITADTEVQANVIEKELDSIDQDLEEDIYSDSSLGL